MRILLALLSAVWSTRGVLRGCGEEFAEGHGEWISSAHWRSREQ